MFCCSSDGIIGKSILLTEFHSMLHHDVDCKQTNTLKFLLIVLTYRRPCLTLKVFMIIISRCRPFQFGFMITSWQLPFCMMGIDCLSVRSCFLPFTLFIACHLLNIQFHLLSATNSGSCMASSPWNILRTLLSFFY